MPKSCLTWISSQYLSSISYRTRTPVSLGGCQLTANSASSNLLGWKSSPSCYIQNPAMQVLFALPVFLRRTTRSWGNYVGDHWRIYSLQVCLLTPQYTRYSQGQCGEVQELQGIHASLLLLLFCGLSNSHHA